MGQALRHETCCLPPLTTQAARPVSSLPARTSWKSVRRLEASALGSDLHDALAGAPAVVQLASTGVRPLSLEAGGTSALVSLLRDVRLDVRPNVAVARSGGAFWTADAAAKPTVSEWLAGDSDPLVFDTKRSSDLHRGLRAKAGVAIPEPLRSWSRSPIATLGRPPAAGGSTGGLSFHRHERNWLYLASGVKRWFFYVGSPEGYPTTAMERVGEAELREREAAAADPEQVTLFTHDQLPGECMLLPDGVWHCTYNVHEPRRGATPDLVVGVGGMGCCLTDAQFFAADGDIAKLEAAASGLDPKELPSLARVAAEQAQPGVLKWLHGRFGKAAFAAGDASGATPMHFAAAAGSVEVVELLLGLGLAVDLCDAHGTTAAHWTARSGSPEVLAVLRAAGADLETQDRHCRCRPLHLMAAEGHLDAVKWLVHVAGVDPIAPDGNGRTPEMWAEASGHHSTAMFLTMVL